MNRFTITPTWSIRDAQAHELSPRLIQLLSSVQREGSLQAACKTLDCSYRHAWALVRQAEAMFNAPLLAMERGKGSRLSPLGEKLVWANHRFAARLKPILDTLASELSAEVDRALAHPEPPLRIHASHGFSVEKLIDTLAHNGHALERRYGSSIAAVAALHDGQCDVCGLHLPTGPLQARALAHYAPWLGGDDWRVIDIATRRQGLMLAPGNPKKVYDLHDLQRDDVHFINRPADSGTRHLLQLMLASEQIPPRRIKGFEQSEATHSAVATCVASGMADVGFGLETPARQFGLDFIPLAKERYFLLCRAATLALPAVQAAVDILRSPAFQQAVYTLPGYDPRQAGTVTPLDQAFATDTGATP